jgi:hypothetical protein
MMVLKLYYMGMKHGHWWNKKKWGLTEEIIKSIRRMYVIWPPTQWRNKMKAYNGPTNCTHMKGPR